MKNHMGASWPTPKGHASNSRQWEDDMVYVYPNPAINTITVGCLNAQFIVVCDLLGNIVFSKALDKNLAENKLELNSLAVGVYIYRVNKADGTTYNGKLIIE